MIIYPIAGGLIVALVLGDLFGTILLARAGGGIVSPLINRTVWMSFRWADKHAGAGGRIMGFAGPVLLVLIVSTWVVTAILGFALIYQPMLGSQIVASSGSTATDFSTALYFSGFNFSTLGLGDLVPQTSTAKLLAVGEACTGFAVFTMAVSYTLNIYSAVNERDTLALLLHADTARTDDPAVALAGLCPGGTPAADAGSALHTLSGMVSSLLQTHYSYPLAHYYRRRDPSLSMVRIADHVLMLVSLAKASLAPISNASLLQSRGLISLDAAGTRLICEVVDMMQISKDSCGFDTEMMRPWFDQAYDRLTNEGIDLTTKETAWAIFKEIVNRFKPQVLSLARQLGYEEAHFIYARSARESVFTPQSQ